MADFKEEYKNWCENVMWRPREIYGPPSVAALARYIRLTTAGACAASSRED
jgi:hypothetical protein